MANPPTDVKVRNRLVHSDPVVGATLTVIGSNPNITPITATPNHQPRRGKDIDLVVVHHTGGAVIQGVINTFLSHSEGTSAHYVIDTDGQIVKMVQEAVGANHAGVSFWDGVNGVNANTIGIEI